MFSFNIIMCSLVFLVEKKNQDVLNDNQNLSKPKTISRQI